MKIKIKSYLTLISFIVEYFVYNDTSIILVFCFKVAVWSVILSSMLIRYTFILSSCVDVHIKSILQMCFSIMKYMFSTLMKIIIIIIINYKKLKLKSWRKKSFLTSCSTFSCSSSQLLESLPLANVRIFFFHYLWTYSACTYSCPCIYIIPPLS